MLMFAGHVESNWRNGGSVNRLHVPLSVKLGHQPVSWNDRMFSLGAIGDSRV